MLSREATNTNFIVFGLIRSGVEPTIYHTRHEHIYTTDAVLNQLLLYLTDYYKLYKMNKLMETNMSN